MAAARQAASIPVVHLIESDGVYGAEQVVLGLVREAAADRRFPAAIACLVEDARQPNALHEHAVMLGLPAIKVPMRKAHAPLDVMRLPSRLRELGAGIIHAHGYKAAIAGYAAHLASRMPVVATCHLWFEESEAKWTYRWLTRVERRLYPRMGHVVAVSAPIAAQLLRWHVSPSRLTEIPNGVRLDREAPAPWRRAALRRTLGVPGDGFVVVHVGRLAEQKAQADLITAAGRLHASHRNLRVVLLGEGHLRPVLDDQIARAGLRDVVQIIGFQEDVGAYLAIADAFALPSVDEGLPIALLEALAAEVPVVCTPVGGIPGLLEHEVSALFVPVHDADALAAAIERLMAEPALRQVLASRGREAVQREHSTAVMYARYREIYSRLVQ